MGSVSIIMEYIHITVSKTIPVYINELLMQSETYEKVHFILTQLRIDHRRRYGNELKYNTQASINKTQITPNMAISNNT